ncbi:MAG TPA: PIN domain-containing protein [Chthonomonadaceae bacterium]|nr:PIN domain-containing protein [Chthonomonadaceae bacterium]
MGSLILPASGLVYADANTVIYSMQRHPVYWPLLKPFWQAVRTTALEAVGSELLLTETLIGPLRAGDSALQTAFEQALLASDILLLPITLAVLREAARLRAAIPALRTPNAIHAATAMISGCVLFLTNDNGFKAVPGLPVVTLDEVLAAP